MKDRLFDIWFSLRVGIANREMPYLLYKCHDTYQIFSADEAELNRLPCGEELKKRLADKDLSEACRIMEYCEKNRIGILFYTDPLYPLSLRSIQDPPAILYWKGVLPDYNNLLCVSVVGTRKMSEYGKRMAYKIGYELAAANTIVVSGMALGIDSVAAAGALQAGGVTVAVLGCGIDITYPTAHTVLRRVIEQNGMVVTEYPPATKPEGRNFPVRNRIISGLSQGTVVVEADMNSGALLTARSAWVQGRNVFAIPGNVGEENTSGTNMLLREEAIMVLNARDILKEYQVLYGNVLHMGRLLFAEKQSETDEDALARLGVCTAVSLPSRNTPKSLNTRKDEQTPRSVSAEPEHTVPKRFEPTKREKSAPAEESQTQLSGISVPSAKRTEQPNQQIADMKTDKTETEGDRSADILDTLTDKQKAVFSSLPLDRAVAPDEIAREGFSIGEIMAAMTVLEVKGLVVSLPGCLYARR